MRFNKSLIRTLRENPANCESESFALMLKTGMVKQESSGLYSYLPYFNMLLQKVEAEIRREMNALNAQECKFPILVSRELLEKSGRWTSFGREMFALKDRSETEYALSPTNEEAAAMIAKQYVTSYKDLPLTVYQINTKHRDEIRPRGIGRTRAFTMKDAYSFHATEDCLNETYTKMVDGYVRLFKRLGLECFPVNADNGTMGGSGSQEVMTISSEGDNEVGRCDKCGYSANLEVFPCEDPNLEVSTEKGKYKKVETPNAKTIDELVNFFGVDATKYAKSIVYKTDEGNLVVAVVRGDREVNEIKLRNILKVKSVELCPPEEISKIGSYVGFVGPMGLDNAKIVCDYEVKYLKDFIIGANQINYHYVDVNIADLDDCLYADLRVATQGDKHECGGKIDVVRAVELGHCFKLGKRYTDKLDVVYTDANNQSKTMTMGCYGIGVERTAVAIINKYRDEFGLNFPVALAPFKVDVISGDKYISTVAEDIYNDLMQNGIETLFDDRSVTFGVKFKDADLLGIPLRVIVGKGYETTGNVEVEFRKGEKLSVEKDKLVETLKTIIAEQTEKFYR